MSCTCLGGWVAMSDELLWRDSGESLNSYFLKCDRALIMTPIMIPMQDLDPNPCAISPSVLVLLFHRSDIKRHACLLSL
jgi:hypothetical protein